MIGGGGDRMKRAEGVLIVLELEGGVELLLVGWRWGELFV